jgi:opacity protein-like surface antigen
VLEGAGGIARLRIIVAIGVLATAYETHAQITHVDGGVHAGSFTRQGEGRDGTTGAYGGWMSIGAERFRLEVDLARSTTLRETGSACVDNYCTRTAAGTSFEREWTFGVAALWHFRTVEPVVPYVLVGLGEITSRYSYDFDDPTIPDKGWRSIQGTCVGGAGLDFPTRSRFFGRVQYRLNFRSIEEMFHQFRVGAGVRF